MFFGPFIKNWCWKVAKALWVLLFVPTSLYQWCHQQDWHVCQKYQICHFFSYSLVMSKATWLSPEECKFKVKKQQHLFCIIFFYETNKQTKACRSKHLHIFYIFMLTCFFSPVPLSVNFFFFCILSVVHADCQHMKTGVLRYHYFVLIVVATTAFKDPWSKSWVH